MKVKDLINNLKNYEDFVIRTKVHLKVEEEELQKRLYGYPYNNYEAELEIDDIGHSDKVILIGVNIKKGV